MRRRHLCFLLSVILSANLLGGVCSASSHLPFERTQQYASQFTDVAADAWYYDNVCALYEFGLSVGDEKGEYAPDQELTLSEVLTFASRLRSLYDYGHPEYGAMAYTSDIWYIPYVRYLQSIGMIGSEYNNRFAQSATRVQVAHILASVLPTAEWYDDRNAECVESGYNSGQYLTDVNGLTVYCEDILWLYRQGISQGSDASGNFHPFATITRAEFAALLTRILDPSLRITITWLPTNRISAKGTTYAQLVRAPEQFYPSPKAWETEKIDADVRYMLSRGENTLTLHYDKGTIVQADADALAAAFSDTVKRYCEQHYNSVQGGYNTSTGAYTFRFSHMYESDGKTASYRAYSLAYAIAVHDELWRFGSLRSDMSEYEKARVYYTWICEHCRYDSGCAKYGDLSHSPYCLFANGMGVCDAYTGAYNLLLRLEGIACYAQTTPTHIWTVATLDGKTYHIDTTWGDEDERICYDYFAMSEEASHEVHDW